MENIYVKPLEKSSENVKDGEKCEKLSSNSENAVIEELIEDKRVDETQPSCCDIIECFHPKKPLTKLRALKNLFVISFGIVIYDCAFVGVRNLQSTMNSADEIGINSLIASNVGFVVTVMFVPPLLIKRFGCKFNMVVTILMASTYFGANFYPHFGTFIPTALLLGVAEAIMWACICTYVAKIGYSYAFHAKENPEVVIAKYFGIFHVFLDSGGIWSSLISYYALKPKGEQEDHVVSNEALFSCGANFCNLQSFSNETNPNLIPPTDSKRYLVTGIFLSCSLCSAVIISLFLDPLDKKQELEGKIYKKISDVLLASVRQIKKRKQICLIPVTIYWGMKGGFYTSVYTEAFIACVWGVHHVGYVIICSATVSCVMCCVMGPLVKCFSRPPVLVVGATANLIAYIYMLAWTPTADEPAALFSIAGIWGFASAIWGVILDAVYADFFKGEEEAAFSNFYFWHTVGFILMYVFSNYLCVTVMIYLLLINMFLGVLGYLIAEFKTCCGKTCPYDMDKGS